MLVPAAFPALSADWYARGERERLWLATVAIGAAAALGVALLLAFGTLTPVWLLIAVLTVAVLREPRIGVYFTIGWAFAFEAGGPDLMMDPGGYFLKGLGTSTGTEIPVLRIFSPFEILLAIAFGSYAVRRLRGTYPAAPRGRLFWPVLAFAGFLVVGFLRGALAGGGLNTALWEVRCLLYTVAMFFLVKNTIRTPAHLRTLMTLAIAGAAFLGTEGIYRRFALLNTGAIGMAREFAFAHDSVILLGTVLLLLIAQLVIEAPVWQRLLTPSVAGVISFTLLAGERRAGLIAVMVALLLYAVVFLRAHRRAFLLLTVPALAFGVVYMSAFWHKQGLLAQPVRAVRSLTTPDARDAASNEYRVLEAQNIRATIFSDPITGVGFGREFLMPVTLPNLSWWPFWRYEPHNNVMWLWLKTGALGFIAFWYLVGSGITQATYYFRTLRQRDARAFALFAFSGLVITLVFCWVDIGLVSARVTLFLGTLLGALSVLDVIGTRGDSALGATGTDVARPGSPMRLARALLPHPSNTSLRIATGVDVVWPSVPAAAAQPAGRATMRSQTARAAAPAHGAAAQERHSVLHRLSLIGPTLNAYVRLRGATRRGARITLRGRPKIENRGTMTLGDRVRLDSTIATTELVSLPGGHLEIGNNVFINHGTSIAASRHVKIGDNCLIGADVMIMDCDFHRVDDKEWDTNGEPVIIEEGAWIANRAIILKGVTIGRGAVVGAGSVVTKDVPPRTLAAGVPAKVVKQF